MSKDKNIYQINHSTDALDGEHMSLDAIGGHCTVCGASLDCDGSVQECADYECPNDVKQMFGMDDYKELNFHD